jgi:hypothetical protein
MKYQEHIKKIQADYFKQFDTLRQQHPELKGKQLWEMLESKYDFTMYSTYDCFRTSRSNYQKTILKQKA